MNINIQASKTPEGGVKVDWTATLEREARYLTITVFWGRKVSTDIKGATGVYGFDSRNTQGQVIELTGSRTVFPAPGKSPTSAIVVANICQHTKTLAEYDQYECADTVTTEPIKL